MYVISMYIASMYIANTTYIAYNHKFINKVMRTNIYYEFFLCPQLSQLQPFGP
jgi:hypothetical protein